MSILQSLFAVDPRELGIVTDPSEVEKEKAGLENIPYKAGDPTSFNDYLGQENLKKRIKLRIDAMTREELAHGGNLKALFSAQAGQGKTAIARVIAHEMANRGLIDNYFEVVAGKIDTKHLLDKFIASIPEFSYVFIDEIHGIQGAARDALLPTIQDNLYPYDASSNMTSLPPGICWVGATTDVGKVHPALQRRLIVMTLEPLSLKDKAFIASIQPYPVSEKAAFEMAKRCFTPWEIKDEIYVTAKDIAVLEETPIIMHKHVLDACNLLGVDENGLRPAEKRVLEALYMSKKIIRGKTRYGMSANATAMCAGIDCPTFFNMIEPKLMKLGYVQVSPGIGRELTPKALQEYF